jgi:hypothetical protein
MPRADDHDALPFGVLRPECPNALPQQQVLNSSGATGGNASHHLRHENQPPLAYS